MTKNELNIIEKLIEEKKNRSCPNGIIKIGF